MVSGVAATPSSALRIVIFQNLVCREEGASQLCGTLQNLHMLAKRSAE